MTELTAKQTQFCNEYIIDFNGAQAAIRAGCSEKTAKEQASRLLTNANVSGFIQGLANKRIERTQITADYVLQSIRDTVEEAREDGDRSNTLRGCELLGKHLNLFTDKVQHSGGIDLSGKSDAELIEMIERLS